MKLLIYLKAQPAILWNWFTERKWIGFILSIKIMLFNSIKRPAMFYGYQMEWFARLFRIKRELLYHRSWNQMGKEQFILPFLRGRLLVCSKLELEVYKKKGLLSKNASIRKIIKKSL